MSDDTKPADSSAPAPAASPSPTKPKGSRLKKVLAVLAILAVLLVVTASLAAKFAVVPYVRNTVIPEMEATYGVQITEEGLSIGLLSGTASMDRFVLAQGDKTFVDATGLVVNVDIGAILDGQTVIDKVVVESLALNMEMQADGQTDLMHIFTDVPSEDAATTDPVAEVDRQVIMHRLDLNKMTIHVTGAADSDWADYDVKLTDLSVIGRNMQLKGKDKGLHGQVVVATSLIATRGSETLLAIGAFDVSLDVSSLIYRNEVIVEHLNLSDVTANLTLVEDGQPDFAALFADDGTEPPAPEADAPATGEAPSVRIDAVKLANINLTATGTDASPWPGVVYTMKNLSADGADLILSGPGDVSKTRLTVSLQASATERGKLLFDTGAATAEIDLPALAKGNVRMPLLTVEMPRARIVVEEGTDGVDTTNLQRLFAPKEPPPEANPVVYIERLRVSDGVVDVESQPGTKLKGHALAIKDLRLWGERCQLAGKAINGSDRGDLRLHAELEQPHGPARLDAVVWATSLAEADADVDVYVALTGLDIGPWPQLNLVNRSAIGGQVLHLTSGFKATGGTIAEGDGEAVLTVRETSHNFPLRFFGPWQTPTVDKNAAMLSALSMTFNRLGSLPLGAGSILSGGGGAASALAKGAFGAVGGVGSSAAGAVGDLATGDVTGAGKSVVSGVGGLFKSVTGTAKDTVTGGASGASGNNSVRVDPAWWNGEFKDLHRALVADFVSRRMDTVGKADTERMSTFNSQFDRQAK